MKTAIWLLAACALLRLAAASAAETPLSAYRDALANNPAYGAARAGAEAERHGIAVARGQLLPNLSVSGNFSRNEADREQPNRPVEHFDYQGYAYSVSLRQPIYRKYNIAQYRQAAAQAELALARADQVRGDLAVKVLNAYLDALLADDIVRLLAARKASVLAQVSAAERAWQAGSGTRIDVDETRAKGDLIVAQEIEAAQQREHARRTLRALIGRAPETLARLDPARLLIAPPQPADVAAWVTAAEANSPELAAARAQVTMAEREVEKARSGHHPTLDLVASAGKSGNDSLATLTSAGDTIYNQRSIGLQLQVPLFAGGQVSAGIAQALEKLNQASLGAEDVRNNLELRLRKEYDAVVQAETKIPALEKAAASAAQTLNSVRKGVGAGVRSTLDVLAADEQAFVVRRDLTQARFEYLLARTRLLAFTGQLTEQDLAAIDVAFSP
jgi:outer membrane protein, protease secretion system